METTTEKEINAYIMYKQYNNLCYVTMKTKIAYRCLSTAHLSIFKSDITNTDKIL